MVLRDVMLDRWTCSWTAEVLSSGIQRLGVPAASGAVPSYYKVVEGMVILLSLCVLVSSLLSLIRERKQAVLQVKPMPGFYSFPDYLGVGVGGCWQFPRTLQDPHSPSQPRTFFDYLRSTNHRNGRLLHKDLPKTFLQCPRFLFSFWAYGLRL